MKNDLRGGEDGGRERAPAAASGNGGGVAACACHACGARVAGPWCHDCGQKHDDMRRSLFLLARDFVEDTFAFDSRMWRTLGLMAAKPGVVPNDYAHGRRSRYTPPVRLFLVVSFLFFLTLGLTDTMVVAIDVKRVGEGDAAAIEIGEENVAEAVRAECAGLSVNMRMFVRPRDLSLDHDAWRGCARAMEDTVVSEEDGESAAQFLERGVAGITAAFEDPRAFNAKVNAWLPRVLFAMTPVLALILALFLRRSALVFDHMVFSLYVHAVGFAALSLAIIFAQAGAGAAVPLAMAAVALYYGLALKRAYRRGVVKTLWTALVSGILYLIILFAVVMTIVANAVVT